MNMTAEVPGPHILHAWEQAGHHTVWSFTTHPMVDAGQDVNKQPICGMFNSKQN